MVNLKSFLFLTILCVVTTQEVFNTTEDAEDLKSALNVGLPDESTIVDILANRTLVTRLDIINEYRKLYDESLVETLDRKLSGNLHTIILSMMKPKSQYYADELFDAIDGIGTDEDVLIEILCTLTNGEIKEVRRLYHQDHGRTLEDDLTDDTSGQFLDLMVGLNKAERDESTTPDQESAEADAQSLYEASGDQRWKVFSDIFINRSYVQLKMIFDEYESLSLSSIESAIHNFFNLETKDGLLAIVGSVKNKPRLFAEKLHDEFSEFLTSHSDIIRIIVTRSEVDGNEVKMEYEDEFKSSLKNALVEISTGAYQQCLLMLIGEY